MIGSQTKELCVNGTGSSKTENPSPLAIAKGRKEDLEKQIQEVDRLITLLEKNPDIEELLKLSRRYVWDKGERMNTLLILLMGYCAGRADHYHKKAKENWEVFKKGFRKGYNSDWIHYNEVGAS